jgi:hypothetical protein
LSSRSGSPRGPVKIAITFPRANLRDSQVTHRGLAMGRVRQRENKP